MDLDPIPTKYRGGGYTTSTKLRRLKITLAYRPDDYKSAWKVEEGRQEVLHEGKWTSLDENKSKITLTSCIDSLCTYLEEIGLDIVFGVHCNTLYKEFYSLKNLVLVQNKFKIEDRIEILKSVLTSPVQGKLLLWFSNEKNIRWYGKSIINSIGMDLWEALEKDLSDKPPGPEFFTIVVSKLKFINSCTIQKWQPIWYLWRYTMILDKMLKHFPKQLMIRKERYMAHVWSQWIFLSYW